MRTTNLSAALLSAILVGCEEGPRVEILQTTNFSSKVTVICSEQRKIYVTDVSGDGTVVVGNCAKKKDPSSGQAFHYTHSSGAAIVNANNGREVSKLHVSADGSAIWGTSYAKNDSSRIFRYTKTAGLHDFGSFGKKYIEINSVSADGSIVVGSFLNSLTGYPLLYRAFRYSQSAGFEDLGSISTDSSHARGVSADGSLIVGNIEVGSNSKETTRYISSHIFRYSNSKGVQDLGIAGGFNTNFPTSVSDDGSIVVGDGVFCFCFIAEFYKDNYVFVYTNKGGMQKLNGIRGKEPRIVRISGDGKFLAGSFREWNGEVYTFTARLVLP